jgi:hypothetical protein
MTLQALKSGGPCLQHSHALLGPSLVLLLLLVILVVLQILVLLEASRAGSGGGGGIAAAPARRRRRVLLLVVIADVRVLRVVVLYHQVEVRRAVAPAAPDPAPAAARRHVGAQRTARRYGLPHETSPCHVMPSDSISEVVE